MDDAATAPPRRPARPRDPERTRARLLAAATREFARHGFAGARVDRITKAAGVNPRMLYHYFGGKEPLYLAVLDEVYADIRAQERQLDLDAGDPVQALRRLVGFTFDFFARNDLFLKLTRNENLLGGRYVRRSRMIQDMSSPLIEAIGRLIDRGLASGAFARGADPLQLYISIVALSAHHLNNADTLSAVFGAELTAPDWIAARRAHALAMILRHLGAAEALDGAPAAPDK